MDYQLFWLLFLFVSLCCCFGGKIVEDDILVPEEPIIQTLSGYTIQTKKWTSGQIPYNLDKSLGSVTRDHIRSAILTIEQKTGNCVQFSPRSSSNTDYLNITSSNTGCYSSVGRVGGGQIVNIGPGCDTVGIIMHELLHALGFWHEQSRTDRDNYVTILYNNILIGKKGEFNTRSDSTGVQSAIGYDFHSILHYKYNQFSEDRSKDTIVPKSSYGISKTELGQRERLSDKDVKRIRWLYSCDTGACSPPVYVNVAYSPVQISYSVGDKITFSCRTGTLTGALSSTCSSDGKWSGEQPQCLKVSLSGCNPPNIQNIAVYPQQSTYNVGVKVHLACKTGSLIGPNATECLSSGAWSGATPYCFQSDTGSFHYCDMEDCFKSWNFFKFPYWNAFWQRYSGATSTPGTGPDTDHTTTNAAGSYMLMEATGVPMGQYAIAFTPEVDKQGGLDICVMFYYYMYGVDLNSTSYPSELYVLIDYHTVWFRKGSTSEGKWTKVVTKKVHITRPTKVLFFTRKGSTSGDKADVAIDDVLVGPCDEVYQYSNTTVNTGSKSAEYDYVK